MTLFEADDQVPAAPEGRLVRVRLLLAYDGSGFHGFAKQAGGQLTVGGALTEALERVLRHSVDITCAGRTDKGVHAWGQVVTFDAQADQLDPDALLRSLNGLLGPRVVVRQVAEAAATFDARFSATARRYRYRLLNAPTADPFLHGRVWHVTEPLDRQAMVLAADPFLGEHDFAAFCRKPQDGGPTTRRVIDARWIDEGDGLLRFEIEANAFCHQMVRSVVGTLVDVGRGRLKAGDMAWIIRNGDRQAAGQLAPPHGLYLWQVSY